MLIQTQSVACAAEVIMNQYSYAITATLSIFRIVIKVTLVGMRHYVNDYWLIIILHWINLFPPRVCETSLFSQKV